MILSRGAHDDIVAHARDAAPAECCGLLIGAGEAITSTVRTKNLSQDANRFEIDPGEHIRARRELRPRGLEVVGFYHSHPRSPAVPSATDLAEALYPDHLYLIVSVRAEPAEVRLYRLREGKFEELAFALS